MNEPGDDIIVLLLVVSLLAMILLPEWGKVFDLWKEAAHISFYR